jgi:hypothetical protein
MSEVTTEELDRLEALEKVATESPWHTEDAVYTHGWKGGVATFNMVDGHCRILSGNSNFPKEAENDAAFAVAIRNAAPALIAAARENARLRAVVEAARKVSKAMRPIPENTDITKSEVMGRYGISAQINAERDLAAALSALDAPPRKTTPATPMYGVDDIDYKDAKGNA